MDSEKLFAICWTVVGLGVCAVIGFTVSTCTESSKQEKIVEQNVRRECVEHGGSVVLGPGWVLQCIQSGKN